MGIRLGCDFSFVVSCYAVGYRAFGLGIGLLHSCRVGGTADRSFAFLEFRRAHVATGMLLCIPAPWGFFWFPVMLGA